jgi:hypothetical protein
VALGYKGNVKVTRKTFVDGWMHTGDQMRIDKDEAFVSRFDKYDMPIHNRVDLSYLQF